ncbi:MAG: hypothetical protein KAI39_09645, partial [Desulfobulbaceae bacterium]|nr:hypothetical protein [Desulfobulbaceae bacterium]
MKRLSKIIFVQWYLFEGQEIPIVGNAAIIGENGAGKSSIIDGVQVVLSGGDKNKISLNKGGNEKSSRTIREYCLGIISDPNSMSRVESRDSANTYIVLCFHDSETDEHFCAGVSIWASATDPKETFNGYFITRGDSLSLDDFTEDTKEGVTTLPWNRVRDRLLRRFSKLGKDFQSEDSRLILPNKGPGDFIRQFYTAMSAEPGMPSNAQTLVKSLLAAIAFKPIADPTKFVRQNMLDPSNINIRELKISLDFWRDLRDKANQTAEYIERLNKLEISCENVQQAETDIHLHEHVSLAARIDECYELASPAEAKLYELDEEITVLDEDIETGKQEEDSVRKKLWEKEQDYDRQDTTQKIQRLKDQKNILGNEQSQLKTLLDSRRLECLKLAQIEKSKASIPEALYSTINRFIPMIQIDDDLLSKDWLKDPAGIDAAVETIKTEYGDKVQAELQKSINLLWSKISPAMKENEERGRIIVQLANNETPLQRKTLGMISLLKKNRITPAPLCDLIDVKDEAWRSTIEAVLGNIREALIVPPQRAREAIRLYRYEGKAYRGVHIVNTTKTEEWKNRSQKGSLAELVTTNDPHARAFINLRLGNIICVEKESDLLKYKRAATIDMMLTSGGVTSMLHEPNLMILGRTNRERQLERLRRLQTAQIQELERLQEKQNNLSGSIKVLDCFIEI